MSNFPKLLAAVILGGGAFLSAQSPTGVENSGAAKAALPSAAAMDPALLKRVATDHAIWCHGLYGTVKRHAEVMQRAIASFVAAPSAEGLAQARTAWSEARKLYGMTETLRFHDGPIEPLEPLINAWPIDEAYVDYVVGRPDCGMVQNPKRYPTLQAAVLQLANERGGEANICVGWHAIEFMLWGQDLRADGAGSRPYTDFVDGSRQHAARRRQYLQAITGLLVQHLGELEAAWAPDADYRKRFVADPAGALKRILTGVTVLSAFELGGERLTVAYDTRDQEQEHSCFSDTTWNDFVANQKGLMAVALGGVTARAGKNVSCSGFVELLRESEPALAAQIERRLAATAKALAAIPQPFDQAFLGSDDGPGRAAMARAIAALEDQTELLLIVGKHLGYDLPLEPGG